MNRVNYDVVPYAITYCPRCGAETFVAHMLSARSGFTATREWNVTCTRCRSKFRVPENRLQVRRESREIVEAQYTDLPPIE